MKGMSWAEMNGIGNEAFPANSEEECLGFMVSGEHPVILSSFAWGFEISPAIMSRHLKLYRFLLLPG